MDQVSSQKMSPPGVTISLIVPWMKHDHIHRLHYISLHIYEHPKPNFRLTSVNIQGVLVYHISAISVRYSKQNIMNGMNT